MDGREALGLRETEMFIAAGHVSREYEPSDDQHLEPERRLFFRDVLPGMSEDKQGVVRDFMEMVRMRMNHNAVLIGRTNECP